MLFKTCIGNSKDGVIAHDNTLSQELCTIQNPEVVAFDLKHLI